MILKVGKVTWISDELIDCAFLIGSVFTCEGEFKVRPATSESPGIVCRVGWAVAFDLSLDPLTWDFAIVTHRR